MADTSILLKPIVTEKMQKISDKLKQFGFVVSTDATKPQIVSAIETMFEVKVAGISTMKYAGKKKSRMTKKGVFSGKRSSFKKAIVTLEEGHNIDIYSNV